MRVLMPASLTLNLLLLASIVAARVDTSVERAAASGDAEPHWPSAMAPAVPATRIDAGTSLADALAERGFAAADIGPMLAGWAESAARADAAAATSAVAFWQPDFVPAVVGLEQELAIEAAVRATLLDLLGPDAAADPAFARFFAPLGPAFAFLTSAEQIRLRESELEHARRRGPAAAAPSCLRIAPAAASEAQAAAGDPLAELLAPAAYEEYLLRFSPRAQQLRELALAPNEADFRAAFGLLRELDAAHDPGIQLDLRQRLRELLGRDAYLAFWSARDPIFAPLAALLESRGVGDAGQQEVYAVLNRTQESLLELFARDADQTTLLNAMTRLRADESARLIRLLGEETARALDAASTRASMQMQAGGRENCPPNH